MLKQQRIFKNAYQNLIKLLYIFILKAAFLGFLKIKHKNMNVSAKLFSSAAVLKIRYVLKERKFYFK